MCGQSKTNISFRNLLYSSYQDIRKLTGNNTSEKKGEVLTCGIFYCRDSAEINVCGSLLTLSWFDSNVLRNVKRFIYVTVIV